MLKTNAIISYLEIDTCPFLYHHHHIYLDLITSCLVCVASSSCVPESPLQMLSTVENLLEIQIPGPTSRGADLLTLKKYPGKTL